MSSDAFQEALRKQGQARNEIEAKMNAHLLRGESVTGAAPSEHGGKDLDSIHHDENDLVEQGEEAEEATVLPNHNHHDPQAHLSLLATGPGSLIVSKKLDVDLYTPPVGITAGDPSSSASAGAAAGPSYAKANDAASGPAAGLSFGKRFYNLADRNRDSSSPSSSAASSSGNNSVAFKRQSATAKGKKKASLLSGLSSSNALLDADDSLVGRPPSSPSARRRAGRGSKGARGGAKGGGGGALLGIGPAGFGVSSSRTPRPRFSSLTSSNGSASATHALMQGQGGAAGASSQLRGGEGGKARHWTHNLFRPSQQTVEVWLDSWWKRWAILAIAPSMIVSPNAK